MADDDRFAASRTGALNPLGKLTAEVPKFKLPEETKEILEREAKALGMDLTGFVRELCIIRAHGKDYVRSLYDRRIEVVAGSGSNEGGQGA